MPQTTQAVSLTHQWGIVTMVGVLIGAFAFLGEISEGAGLIPSISLLSVASVFIGLGAAGLLIAYAFLGSPLGLVHASWRNRNNS
jgi:hypothetical protein